MRTLVIVSRKMLVTTLGMDKEEGSGSRKEEIPFVRKNIATVTADRATILTRISLTANILVKLPAALLAMRPTTAEWVNRVRLPPDPPL